MGTERYESPSKWRIFTVYAVVIAAVIIFIWYTQTIQAPDTNFDEYAMTEIHGLWTVEYEGSTFTSELPVNIEVKAMTPVRYSIKLKENYDTYMNSLMIRAIHQYYRIFLDGELIGEYGYENQIPFGQRPYNSWVLVRFPDDWQGKILTIEEMRYYKHNSGALSRVQIGTRNTLVLKQVRASLPFLMADSCILIASLILIAVSFLYRKRGPVEQLRYLGFFAFITGAWMMLESVASQIFYGNGPLVSNLIFILFSMIPLAASGFILTYESFSRDSWMKVMYWLAVLNFVVVHILQITGIRDYICSLSGSHLILLGIAVGLIWKLIQIRKHRLEFTDKSLYLSCFVLIFFACMDIVRFYIGNPGQNSAYFTQAGLFLFFLTLPYYAILRIFKNYESGVREDVLEHMAYTDVMTGLPNRNAFEQEMNELRGSQNIHPVIALADLNGLKYINDKFGHKQGDEALVAVASVFREQVEGRAEVYRIGGDEFCMISREMTVKEMEKVMEEAGRRLLVEGRKLGLPIFVAVGCSGQSGKCVDEVLKLADTLMYRRKKEMKKKLRSAESLPPCTQGKSTAGVGSDKPRKTETEK